jgi:diaminopimelate decarboxylase
MKIQDLQKIKGKSILLLPGDIDRIERFAEVSARKHQAHGRDITRVKRDIIAGKKGEFVLYRLCQKFGIDIPEPNLNWDHADGGIDFHIGNDTTDVKALKKDYYKKVYFSEGSYYKNNYYSVVQLGGNLGTYIGSIEKAESLDRVKRNENNVTYFDKSLFENSNF